MLCLHVWETLSNLHMAWLLVHILERERAQLGSRVQPWAGQVLGRSWSTNKLLRPFPSVGMWIRAEPFRRLAKESLIGICCSESWVQPKRMALEASKMEILTASYVDTATWLGGLIKDWAFLQIFVLKINMSRIIWISVFQNVLFKWYRLEDRRLALFPFVYPTFPEWAPSCKPESYQFISQYSGTYMCPI